MAARLPAFYPLLFSVGWSKAEMHGVHNDMVASVDLTRVHEQ